MIGLDFVKHVDKDWKKHITFVDGSPYCDDYCPLSGTKCRQDDCSFWNNLSDVCGYVRREETLMLESEMNIRKNINAELIL